MRQIEEAAALSWPAAHVERIAGCVLRHTPGLPRRRTSSALPLLGTPDSIADRITAIESFYTARQVPPQVQVSPLEAQRELDAALADRGYQAHTPVLVLATTADAVLRSGADHAHVTTDVDKSLIPDWSALLHELAGGHEPAVDEVLPLVPDPIGFAIARLDGHPAGVAMFPTSGAWTGVFCMATRPSARRQGVASALLRAGARWARQQGSDRLYLQVTEDNSTARHVYVRHGFRLSHRYHYRRLD